MTTPIRVLMITSEWPTPQRPFDAPYLVRQFEFLRRAGVDVDVFAFRGARRPLNYLRAWWRLRRHLALHEYDLVHAQFGQSSLLPWPKRLPLVITFHGCDIQGVKQPDGRMSRGGRFLQVLSQFAATRADAVILVSERMRQFIPARAAAAASVIPMGLHFDEIPLVPQQSARRQLGLPPDAKLVLFVGNPAEPVKRYELARRSVEVLNRTTPATLIVGVGKPHAEILLLMNACDALLVTSIQEGSPCVVKEALACNLPIVSLDVGDVPVRVRDVEGCEICVDEHPETIAAALGRVLTRGQRTRGRAAVADLDERLLADRVVRIYQSVLALAAAHRRGAAARLFSRSIHARPS